MKKLIWLMGISAGGVFLGGVAHAEVKYPYKMINGEVVYQRYGNVAPVSLDGAKKNDFTLLANSDDMAVGRSDNNYYCNGTRLPKDFDPSTAKILDAFLLTNTGAYAGCKLIPQTVDAEQFTALEFPFYSDGKHIFTRSGDVMENVDIATFKAPVMNQAYDKKHYFYAGKNKIVIPYQHSVKICTPSASWANVDSQVYYRGEKRADVDASSLHCLTQNTAVSNAGFYTSGKLQPFAAEGINASNITSVKNDDKVFTDGPHVWFVNVDAQLLEGVNSKSLNLEKDGSDYTISDGSSKWECASFQNVGEPACHKV